jgi:hypothetical protein
MKYSLVIYNDSELERDPVEARQVMDATEALLDRAHVTGWVQLAGLDATTTVRHDQGKTLLTDGPYIESKDYIGGLIHIDVADLDAAIAVAGEFQAVRHGAGAIEIRPISRESPAGA